MTLIVELLKNEGKTEVVKFENATIIQPLYERERLTGFYIDCVEHILDSAESLINSFTIVG